MFQDHTEHVRFPHDFDTIKVSPGRTYTSEEIIEFSKNCPEASWPWDVWVAERYWTWLINSKGCQLK